MRHARRQVRLLRLYACFTYPFACVPFLWFWFADRGVSLPRYGTLVSVYYLAMVLAEIPTGMFADRFGHRLSLVLGPAVLAAGFWTIGSGDGFAWYCAGEALLGLGHAILSGPPAALMFATVAARGRTHDFQRQEARAHGFRLFGTGAAFLLGGYLVSRFDIGAAIDATALLCLVASVTALFLEDPPRQVPATPSNVPFLASALHDLRRPAIAWTLAWFVVLFVLLRFPFHTYQPYLRQANAEDPWAIGVLFFALNMVAAPASRALPWLNQRFGEGTLCFAVPAVLAASLVVMSGEASTFGIALFFVHQVPFGLHWPLLQGLVHHRIGDRSRATVLSVISFASRLVFAVVFPWFLRLPLESGYALVGGLGLLGSAVLAGVRRRAFAAANPAAP